MGTTVSRLSLLGLKVDHWNLNMRSMILERERERGNNKLRPLATPTHMTLPEGEALHADGAIFLWPAVPGQPQWILWSLTQIPFLLSLPSAGSGVKVRGGLDLGSYSQSPPQLFPGNL